MRKLFFSVIVVLVLVLPFRAAQAQDLSNLSVDITIDNRWQRAYDWSIVKSANLFELIVDEGSSGLVDYQIQVDRWGSVDTVEVYGEVCVTNNTQSPAADFAINVSVGEGDAQLALVTVETAALPQLEPGGQGCYAWTADLSASFLPGGTYTAVADVASGEAAFQSAILPTSLSSEPTLSLYESITVTDTNGMSWSFTDSGSVSYQQAYTCLDAGPIWNTATIVETGGNSTTTVLVACSGCTQPKSYWKTHSSPRRAGYDETWSLIGPNTPFYQTGMTWVEMIKAPLRRDPYRALAQEYIAAWLNNRSGAYLPVGIDNAMRNANMLLATYNEFPGDEWYLSNMSQLSRTLQSYNTGQIGPGRCTK
jgi:hypothetical protein